MKPNPFATDDNVPNRQPAYCPYCGHDGAFDGLGPVADERYRHRCSDCGYTFITELPDNE